MRGSLVKEHYMETSVGPLHVQEYFSDPLGSPERRQGASDLSSRRPPASAATASGGFGVSVGRGSSLTVSNSMQNPQTHRYRPPHERAAAAAAAAATASSSTPAEPAEAPRRNSFGSSNRSSDDDDDGGVFDFEMDSGPPAEMLRSPQSQHDAEPLATSSEPRRGLSKWSPSLLDNQDWGPILDPDRSYEITVVDDSGRRHLVDADHSGGLYAWTTVKILKDVLRRLLFPGARDIKLVVFFQRRELTNNAHTLLDCRIEDDAEIFVTQESDELSSNVSLYGGYRPLPVLVELAFACSQGLRRGYRPQLARDGTGGTYYLYDSFKSRCAMFKPEDEESYAPNNPRGYVGKKHSTGFRPGILSCEGAVRECAAFLLDRDRFHNVPYTAMCSVDAGEEAFHYSDQVFRDMLSTSASKRSKKIGALQEYVDAECDVGDMGVSRFSDLSVHKIGLLDLRILNCDRNDGNILVQRDGGELNLIPIDHGLSLPAHTHMIVYWHEWAWLGWPQAKRPFDEKTLAFIEAIDIDADCRVLKSELSIRDECILTLRVTTLFLKVAAKAGLTLSAIGNMVARQKESEKSQLEVMMDQARVLASPTRVKRPSFSASPQQRSTMMRGGARRSGGRHSRARSQPGSAEPHSPPDDGGDMMGALDSPDSFGASSSGFDTPVMTPSLGAMSVGNTPMMGAASAGSTSRAAAAMHSPSGLLPDTPFSLGSGVGSPLMGSSFSSSGGGGGAMQAGGGDDFSGESAPMQIPGADSRPPERDPFGIDFSMDFSVGMMTPSLPGASSLQQHHQPQQRDENHLQHPNGGSRGGGFSSSSSSSSGGMVPHSLPVAAADFPRSLPPTSLVRSSTDEEYTTHRRQRSRERSPLLLSGSIPRPALKRSSSTLRFSEMNHSKALAHLDSLPELSFAQSAEVSTSHKRRGDGGSGADGKKKKRTTSGARNSPSANRLSALDLDSNSRSRSSKTKQAGLEIENSAPFFFYLRELFESAAKRRKAQLVKQEAERQARVGARGARPGAGRFARTAPPMAAATTGDATCSQKQQQVEATTSVLSSSATASSSPSSSSSSSSSTSLLSQSSTTAHQRRPAAPAAASRPWRSSRAAAAAAASGAESVSVKPSSEKSGESAAVAASAAEDATPAEDGDAEEEEDEGPNFYDQISFSPRPTSQFFRPPAMRDSYFLPDDDDFMLGSPRARRSRRMS